MPRIPHSTLLKAYKKSPLLPLVLRGSRTLPSAINELRWLKEHVEETSCRNCPGLQNLKLLQLCRRRSKGEPLQYILGSQPFGELDIKCRPGVLIPRPETESYTTYLAHLVTSHRLDHVLNENFLPGDEVLPLFKNTKIPALKILDLCTGSGCIPLLLNSLISKSHKRVNIYGWDISETAIALAKENWKHNFQLGHVNKSSNSHVHFQVVDIFDRAANLRSILYEHHTRTMDNPQFDIIISNPPYISREAFRKETTRSVRNWEPKLALVPRKLPKEKRSKDIDPTDIFYHRLLVLHSDIFKSQVLLMEVGDEVQAIRVAKMAMGHCGASNHIEIWKDNPNVDILENIHTGGSRIPVRGSGSFRAVTLFRFSRHQESSQFKES